MSNSLSKQVPINILTNVGVFILNIIINLFITPFYIKYLGVDGFGVVRLALLLPIYINLATLIISGAVSRFLTIDLHEKNHDSANVTFNTSLFSISTILIIAVPLMVYFALNITSFLNIPDLYRESSIYLFLGIFISSQLSVFSSLFLIPAYANNRLDVQNCIKIATLFIQTSAIIVAFIFIYSNIKYIGYSYVVSDLIGLVLSIFIWKKFAPYLKISKSFVQVAKFKKIASMGSWILVNQLGSILFLSVDLIIINYFFGAEATGEYSIILQWSILLRSLAGMIASVFAPIIVISYAKNNFEEIVKYSKTAVKFMGILIAIPVGLILGFATPLFSLWLGSGAIKLVPLLWLMIAPLAINLAVLPLFSINTAYNKVKIPGLVSLGFGLMNLILAIVLAVPFEQGIYGVALASAIVLTAKNTLFTPIYAAHILNIKKFNFVLFSFYGLGVLIITFFISKLISDVYIINNWFTLIAMMLLITMLIIPLVWIVLLNDYEKESILNIFFKKTIFWRKHEK